MRPRLTLLRRWPLRQLKDRPRLGKRAFSFTQGAAAAHWSRSPRPRPQLPFLVIPSSSSSAHPPKFRYFTTQRKQWLKYEALAFVKYTLYFWAAVGCFVGGQFVVQQEWMERAHPTPPEWSFMSRFRLRGALSERESGDVGTGNGSGAGNSTGIGGSGLDEPSEAEIRVVDHPKLVQVLLDLITRLEDPAIDGAGLVGVLDSADGVPFTADSEAMDIRSKSEPWRRGYFETLLAAADMSEHVEGWVIDRTRNLVSAPEYVIGPSNPHPKPLPPGASGAPLEENCEPIFPAPSELYLKLLHTRGLTVRQQLTAALAFANYLEYKDDVDAAAYVYSRAVLAAGTCQTPDELGDRSILAPRPDEKQPSAAHAASWAKDWATNHADDGTLTRNLTETLTAYATFRARTGDVSGALPIFVGLLKARRALPPGKDNASSPSQAQILSSDSGLLGQLKAFFRPPVPPSAPDDDGFGPPLPGPQARCEEAALLLHIGEILYASARKNSGSWLSSSSSSSSSNASREEGIAWTREAVDMAEEQLHALSQKDKEDKQQQLLALAVTGSGSDKSAENNTGRGTCRECLVTGLDNWAAMVAQLARDEKQRKQSAVTSDPSEASAASSSWSFWPSSWNFWGDSSSSSSSSSTPLSGSSSTLGRWAAEEKVIQDRRRRAKELLDDSAPAPQGFLSMFSV